MARVSGTSNPTHLREIARKHIGLSRFEKDGKRMFQVVRLDLASYGFSGSEQVVVIARAGNTRRRYEIGSLSAPNFGPYELDGLDTSHVLRFRLIIKKESSAKLIASAENLRCAGDGELESLLPIESADLGQKLWWMILDEDGPVLQCNVRIFPTGASAQNFPPFRALVIPEALRRILEYVADDPECITAEGTIWGDWGAWMRELGIEMPPVNDKERVGSWIAESIGTFCDRFKFADDLQQILHQGDAP